MRPSFVLASIIAVAGCATPPAVAQSQRSAPLRVASATSGTIGENDSGRTVPDGGSVVVRRLDVPGARPNARWLDRRRHGRKHRRRNRWSDLGREPLGLDRLYQLQIRLLFACTLHWIDRCTIVVHEKSCSSGRDGRLLSRVDFNRDRSGVGRCTHRSAAASSARVSRAAAARSRIRLGRGLLVSARAPLRVAQRLLDAAAVCGRVLGPAVLDRRPMDRGPLGRFSRQRVPQPWLGSQPAAGRTPRAATVRSLAAPVSVIRRAPAST